MDYSTIKDYILQVGIDFWHTSLDMSPFLLFGFLVAGLLSILVSRQVVETHLGGRGPWPLLKAAAFGVPLPLCSCGVIPVSMSLHKHGASKGSTISFLLSTPQTGADSILVTLSLLGPLFAVYRPFAALLTGILGGTFVNLNTKREEPLEPCQEECCSEEKRSMGSRLASGLKYGFVTLPRDIGKALLVGLLIAAVISAFVPENFFSEYIGTGIGAMLLMMVLGIPVYVCATASIPVAAAMIMKGLAPGAALVFLMTGPATNAASFVTIWKTLGKKTAVIYILTVAICALVFGFIINFLAYEYELPVATQAHAMLPYWIKLASTVGLFGLLVYGLLTSKKGH